MHGEPGGALPPVGGDDEDGIRGERHRDAVRHPDHAHVDAVLWADEHVAVHGPEAPEDHLLEQLGGGLAGPLLGRRLAHRRRSS